VSTQCIFIGKKPHLFLKNLQLVNKNNKNLGSKGQTFYWKTTKEHKNERKHAHFLIKWRLFSC